MREKVELVEGDTVGVKVERGLCDGDGNEEKRVVEEGRVMEVEVKRDFWWRWRRGDMRWR